MRLRKHRESTTDSEADIVRFEMALLQMRVVGGDKAGNLAQARTMIAEAARHGSRLVVLPEAMDLGWTHPSCHTDAESIPDGEPCRQLAQAAAEHGVFVCAGLTERSGEQVFNAAVIIDPAGKVLCVHRKLNELDIGHDCYAQGDRLHVVHTELGALGLMICADGFAPDRVISRSLCMMGADIIVSPCAWAVPADHDNVAEPYGATWRNAYQPVARDFAVWIAGVSNVGAIDGGPWTGRHCIGCSLVVGPDGREVIQGPYGSDAQTILYVNVQPVPRPTRGSSWGDYWNSQPALPVTSSNKETP